LTLARMKNVAVARLNTLMHCAPDAPLPPPPDKLVLEQPLPSALELRELATRQRPDLQALTHRRAEDEAALQLACQERRPDVEVIAAYDTMMGNGPMRDLAPQVGVRLNLPVRVARREGAIGEAQSQLAKRRAELDARIDQVNLQVQEAYEQVVESEQIVHLYEKTILPAALENVDAARSAYEKGMIPFLSLIEAQRSRVMLLERSYEAYADYFRRRATLERVVGGSIINP
jgi:cobalt-zinc-cadmium efflux system outer membrane protein